MQSREMKEALPEVDEIESEELRKRVLRVWELGFSESDYETLENVPWWPPLENELNVTNTTTVDHVREVTRLVIGMVDSLASLGYTIDRDISIAGALVHDISKFVELSGDDLGEFAEWLPHPHYAVHMLAAVGFSPHLQHIALSHSSLSSVEPRTIEARIVQAADELIIDAMFSEYNGSLPD
jgi:hypothetical protein